MAAALGLILVSGGGCLGTGAFVRTGTERLAPRPARCSFALFTAAPPPGSIELGVVDFRTGLRLPMDFDEVREVAGPHVCAAGGDALVVGSETDDGTYSSATIIKVPAASADAGAGP
jgi:hypothetical protein